MSEEQIQEVQEKEVKSESEIKLFDRWNFNVEVKDISLEKYINVEPIIIPHTGGKHQAKRFWKTQHISIVERFINKLLAPGLIAKKVKGHHSSYNSGKKQMIINTVLNAFTIIEQNTGKNPIQTLVSAIEHAAPREETTRISMGGISYQQAVDVAPQRRVDLSIKLIVHAVSGKAYGNIVTFDEILANELILAGRNDKNSAAVRRKDEIERMAISAR